MNDSMLSEASDPSLRPHQDKPDAGDVVSPTRTHRDTASGPDIIVTDAATLVTVTGSPRRPLRPQLATTLRLHTDSAIDSPSAPAYQPSTLRQSQSAPTAPSQGPWVASPKAERLPSFRQLSKIADAGGEDPQAPVSYPHSAYPPPPTMPSQSPIMTIQPPLPLQHTSPSATYGYLPQTASASLQRDPYYTASPPSATYTAAPYYSRRRSIAYPNPPTLPGIPTASSSGESGGHRSSFTNDSYGTAQTTPIDSTSIDAAMRPILPPIPDLQQQSSLAAAGSFICDYSGCTAAPFQTQYLLK